MSITEIYNLIKSIVPEAINISNLTNQTGIYILFDSLKQDEWKRDRAKFRIVIASRSLVDDNFRALVQIDELRQRFLNKAHLFAEDAALEVTFDGFDPDSSLFKYSIIIGVNLYRDDENDLLGEL